MWTWVLVVIHCNFLLHNSKGASNEPQLTLSNLKKASLDEKECTLTALDTASSCNMITSITGSSCQSGKFNIQCPFPQSTLAINTYLAKLNKSIPASPIDVTISKIEPSTEAFLPMKSNIIRLGLDGYSDFNTDRLKTITLPNLIELRFRNCKQVRVTKNGLGDFSKLRSLSFFASTIHLFEPEVFDSLSSLKLLVLDGGLRPADGAEVKAHLKLLHCDPTFSWLRTYLQKNPELIRAKKEAEIINIAGQFNLAVPLRGIFYPVDCARDDLTQKGNFDSLTAFSINVKNPTITKQKA